MSNWKEKPLSEYCEFQEGYVNPPKGHSEYFGGDIKWCRAVDINNGYVYSTSQTLTDAGFNSAKKSAVLFKPNTIVITKSGTIGRLGIIKDYMCGNRATINIIPKNNADVEFVFYLLRSRQNEFFDLAVGSVQKNLYVSILEKMMFKFPSLYEQKKIASFFSVIDKKIDINNRINRNLSEQASAYYENWKMSLTGEAVELSKVIDVRDGTHASPKPQDEGYPLVTSKHLFEYDVDLESPNKISQDDYDKTNERSKVEYHDVLMSMIGTVGVVSFISRQEINFAIKNVALFRTSQKEELAYYVLLFLKSKDTKQYIKSCMAGSTQQYISLTELRKIPIIVPGEAIKEFNLVIKPIIDMICANVIENRRLSELRDTLLPKLMSGELDVSDLDI